MKLSYKTLLFITITTISLACSDNVTEKNKDPEPQIPPVQQYTDEEIMTKAQQDAFKYFWNFAEPNSKLARERYHPSETYVDPNLVATGAAGFGLMTIVVGIERGFVSKDEAVTRLSTALEFLENADRFHGAWSHWINGTNGRTIPFGSRDDGGDIVETAFLCQGLIVVREYFKNGNEQEQALAAKADLLWKGVDWNWYTKGENVMYWHWSPTIGFEMNMKLEGYNECLIAYVMGAASPTHPISPETFSQGWSRNGNIVSANNYYNIPVVVKHNGAQSVGPMFWAHYSYLGLDPRGLTDQYVDYWKLNQNHTKIMYEFCVANPGNYTGYGENCWGLTASYSRDNNGNIGYTDHKPGNDKGVITPTAALSSFPYTPTESMKVLRFLYEDATWSEKLIGPAGPYDAFSPHHNWVARRYLGIDQGTIAPMIENHRTGLIWNLFMKAPEVKQGLTNLGFTSTQHGI